MTNRALNTDSFPRFGRSMTAEWVPIILEPIEGSVERLVIGVAVVSDEGVHVESANALDRLKCLYGPDGVSVASLAAKALEDVQEQLFAHGHTGLQRVKGPFTGIHIGEPRSGEGDSLQTIARNWLSIVSSLHDHSRAFQLTKVDERAVELASYAEPTDQIATQVMHEVLRRRAGLKNYFNPDIREGRVRRARGKAHEVMIDFSGSKLVANFDVLRFNQLTKSSDSIKRRLWDLKVDRDREPSELAHRRHEMLIQAPAAKDPQLTPNQNANVEEALSSLEAQADQEELRLVRLPSAVAISERVLEVEAA